MQRNHSRFNIRMKFKLSGDSQQLNFGCVFKDFLKFGRIWAVKLPIKGPITCGWVSARAVKGQSRVIKDQSRAE